MPVTGHASAPCPTRSPSHPPQVDPSTVIVARRQLTRRRRSAQVDGARADRCQRPEHRPRGRPDRGRCQRQPGARTSRSSPNAHGCASPSPGAGHATLPVVPQLVGEPAPGYRITSVTVEPLVVTVSGEERPCRGSRPLRPSRSTSTGRTIRPRGDGRASSCPRASSSVAATRFACRCTIAEVEGSQTFLAGVTPRGRSIRLHVRPRHDPGQRHAGWLDCRARCVRRGRAERIGDRVPASHRAATSSSSSVSPPPGLAGSRDGARRRSRSPWSGRRRAPTSSPTPSQ